MEASRRQVLGIAGRALMWLPAFLVAWHFASAPIAWVAGQAARPGIALATGGPVAVKLEGNQLAYAVSLEAPYRPGAASSAIVVEAQVLAGQFTYGLALFLALVAASRRHVFPRWGIAAAFATLAILPAFGIALDVLKQLGMAPALQPLLGWPGGLREAIALGYQVGSLLLPALAPVAAWLLLARRLWMPPSA